MHLSLKTKALLGLFAFDALLGITSAITGSAVLAEWMALNAAVILPALYIRKRLRARKQRAGETRSGVSRRQHDQTYQSHTFTHTTLKGENVKSYGEKMVADYFFQNNISYEYEKPAMERKSHVRNGKRQSYRTVRRISRPDFYLPDFGVYVEYWGLADAHDPATKGEYLKSMNWKMAKYHENGIKFISLYQNNLDNLDANFKSKLRDVTGVNPSGRT